MESSAFSLPLEDRDYLNLKYEKHLTTQLSKEGITIKITHLQKV
jgi:hypothetical protein